VLVWHITWACEFGDASVGLPELRNRRGQPATTSSVGFISNGEGWHNNHHADPRSAPPTVHRRWEIDNTWLTIRLPWRWLGLGHRRSWYEMPISPGDRQGSRLMTRGTTGVPGGTEREDALFKPNWAMNRWTSV